MKGSLLPPSPPPSIIVVIAIQGGIEYCVARAVAYSPYADLIWMETKKPYLSEARTFAHAVHARVPHQMLAYNLSPSFNWDDAGMSDQQIQARVHRMGRTHVAYSFAKPGALHS